MVYDGNGLQQICSKTGEFAADLHHALYIRDFLLQICSRSGHFAAYLMQTLKRLCQQAPVILGQTLNLGAAFFVEF